MCTCIFPGTNISMIPLCLENSIESYCVHLHSFPSNDDIVTRTCFFALLYLVTEIRAWHIPLPDGPGQVKLPVWQGDLSKDFYYRQVSNIRCTFSRQLNCWSLRCSWSIACRCCSNYIFVLHLTPGFNILRKDNGTPKWETFEFCDLVHLILEIYGIFYISR